MLHGLLHAGAFRILLLSRHRATEVFSLQVCSTHDVFRFWHGDILLLSGIRPRVHDMLATSPKSVAYLGYECLRLYCGTHVHECLLAAIFATGAFLGETFLETCPAGAAGTTPSLLNIVGGMFYHGIWADCFCKCSIDMARGGTDIEG
jgi:hypothetical protein